MTLPRPCRLPRRLSALVGVLSLVLALAAGLASASVSRASSTEQSWFQDDNLLVYGTASTVTHTLNTLAALGVDTIRVSVFWSLVAPNPTSRTVPSFNATDPNAYPVGTWDRYDTIDELARARGIAVDFDVTSPVPLWATTVSPFEAKKIADVYNPSATEFGQFVTALGTRYSGAFVPTTRPAPDAVAGAPLPRVSTWSIWNEPNQPGWLDPQWNGTSTKAVMEGPRIYRGLLDAAWSGLAATGHTPATDTITIGETAPKGVSVRGITRAISPVPFIQSLYCVGTSWHALSGSAATAQGCPSAPNAGAFRAAHPGLFQASGYAHHPYELLFAPTTPAENPRFITLANLSVLTSDLSRALGAYHVSAPLGLPLYLTEYGYITNPPNPLGVTLAQQAAYLNEAEFITYYNPAVKAFSQFLLVDAAPKTGATALAAYGGTFQTGLETLQGKEKPALPAYRLPIDIPGPRFATHHTIRVWGLVRPASRTTSSSVVIQYESTAKGAHWSTLASVSTMSGTRYIDVHVRPPGSGLIRLAWTPPGFSAASTIYSRAVAVTAA
jgi:hypothetical protein